MKISESLRELLAGVQHDIWSYWMKYMFTQGYFTKHMSLNEKPDETTWTMPSDRVERWKRQMETNYFELTEKERESDRHQADKVISVLELEVMNARLIAAAPDLLSLCQDIYMRLAEWQESGLIQFKFVPAHDIRELERIEVALESAILAGGGELPPQD